MAVRAFSRYRYYSGSWGSWTTFGSGSKEVYCYWEENTGIKMAKTVAFQLPGYGSGTVTSIDLTLSVKGYSSASQAVTCFLLNYNPTGSAPVQSDIFTRALARATVNVSGTSFQNKIFTFSGISVNAGTTLYAIIGCASGDGNHVEVSTVPQGLGTLSLNIDPGSIDLGQSTEISFENRYGLPLDLTYSRGSTQLDTGTATQDSIDVEPTQEWFTKAGGTLTSMSVTVQATDGVRTARGTFTLTKPALGFTLSPDPYATGKTMALTFQNRNGQTVTLQFTRSGTVVHTITDITDNAVTFTPTDSWLASGATSSSINIKATDTLNRTATGTFTLKKSATVSNLYPNNVTRTASNTMAYSWSVGGGTTQASAEVYVNNNLIGRVTGSTQSISSSYRPPAGTVTWYVKVTNNLGVETTSSTASFTLNYSATSYLNPYSCPTSGYIRRNVANSFYVQILAHGTPYTDFTFGAAPRFYYKLATASTYLYATMTLASSNKTASVTIAANTFSSAAEYNWYISGMDNTGSSVSTPVYTVNAAAAPISCTPTAPIDTIENRNTPTVFRWSTASAITSPQTAFEIQYSTNNSSWTQLVQRSTSATSYEAAAQALPSGTIYWKVRARNSDSVWGSWSAAVTYTNFGAPVVTDVIADGKPRTTFTWETELQQAYRVTVDGTVYGPYFGASTRSFQIPEYLANGAHTVTVEAQNEYGQWSAPTTRSFQVTNIPGSAVKLGALMMRDAELSWSSDSSVHEFFIYRDGVRIGRTTGYAFTDRTVLGYHTWEILNPLPGGYYTKSNSITGTLCSGTLLIAPLSGGEWLDLSKSTNSGRAVTYNFARTVSVRQFAGELWPEAEVSPYRTLSVSFDVAWNLDDKEQADAFAALIGTPVILKDPQEGALVGILTAYTRTGNPFYRAYSVTVQRIHWEDYVDADN